MRYLLYALGLLIAGCGGDSKVLAREQYWTQELTSFFEDDRTLTQLHAWLRGHDVYYAFDPKDVADGKWSVELERIVLNEIICESWFLFLDVTVDDIGRIESYALEQTGVCL